MSKDNILFSDIFEIKDIDREGKKFDRGPQETTLRTQVEFPCYHDSHVPLLISFIPSCFLPTSSPPIPSVSRLEARSENYEMDLVLDFNNELYPLDINDKFSLVLASTLAIDGIGVAASEKRVNWRERQAGERDLSDEYEYVTYGKVYKFDESGSGGVGMGSGHKVSVLISYGGLLMGLEGDYRHLQTISVGQFIYCLIRK